MASVTITKSYADPRDKSSPLRWYVWTRGRTGKRKIRIETYLAQMLKAGRTEHAANVLATAKQKGYRDGRSETGPSTADSGA